MKQILQLAVAAILLALLLWLLPGTDALAAESRLGTVPPPTAFAKSALTNTVTAGSPITFSLRFTREPALNVAGRAWITDTLPAGLAFVPGSAQATLAPTPTIAGSRLTWQGDVPSGGRVHITYTAVVSPAIVVPLTLTNTAVWRGAALGEPGAYIALTQTVTVTARPRVYKTYMPVVLHKWPPLPGPFSQLDNWNFDQGRTGWEEIGDKLIFSNTEKPLPGGSEGYFAWLGGTPNTTHELGQQHTFAADHFSLGLYFTYWIASQEQDCRDDEKVELRVGGELLWSKQLCAANRTSAPGQPGWVRLDPEVDVSRFAGKTVEVSFKSVLNDRENSNFFLDKVTICTNDPRLTVDRCP